jgi:hypothetical protein
MVQSDFAPNPSLAHLNGCFLRGLILNQQMSDSEIVDHVFSLLCASLSGTANIASFMCLLLAQNPAVQEKLRNEIYMTTGKEPISLPLLLSCPQHSLLTQIKMRRN